MYTHIKNLIFVLIAVIITNSYAQATKSNNSSGEFLGSSGTRIINFDVNDFGSNSSIDQITVLIEFSSEDDGTIGLTFHEDLAFRLESPSGTTVDLVYDVRGIFTGNNLQSPTYGGFTPSGTVQVTFDDNASQSVASSPGGDPTSGTFVPIEPLSSFLGESPIGDWTLYLADSFDNGFNDKLLFSFASISITTTPTLSLNSNDLENFIIYPTVTEDKLYIKSSSATSYSAEIYNTLGVKVWSSIIKNKSIIDISSFEAGIYLISINVKGKKSLKKFIKT